MNEPGIERKQRTPAKVLPLRQAIRAKCLWCCCDSALEVRLCPSDKCPLHVFRFTKRRDGETDLTMLQAAHAKCIDCKGGSAYDAHRCTDVDCPLFWYKNGHYPKPYKLLAEHSEAPDLPVIPALDENKTIAEGGTNGGE